MDSAPRDIKPLFWGDTTLTLLQVIDDDGAARAWFDAFGGQEACYVPRRPRRDHPWVNALGWDAFRRVCAAFGGERVSIPKGACLSSKKWGIARALLAGQDSQRDIARRFACTERHVRAVARQVRAGAS